MPILKCGHLVMISIFKSAGLKTIWLSNQGFIGEHDTPISSIGYRSDEHRFPVAGEYHKNGLSDFFLLERFQSILSTEREQPMLIVLHTIGSHPDACKKYQMCKISLLLPTKNINILRVI